MDGRVASGIQARVADAGVLWAAGRRESALLLGLVALASRARAEHRHIGDREAFTAYIRQLHGWTISVEYRGQQVDTDQLLYKWLRCELVHAGSLPPDIQFDDSLGQPGDGLAIRAGGAPEYCVLLSPSWFGFICRAASVGVTAT